ncbi:MAG: hypothetical protein RLN90_09640 [Balneolaceae bacterium]
MMNHYEWSSKDNQAKIDHFTNSEVVVQNQQMMNAMAKVSDPVEKKLITYYQAICGGVIVSAWCKSEKEAIENASANIAANIQQLTIKN